MPDAGRDGSPGGVSRYGMLPPDTGQAERMRLVGLGIACALPLPLVVLLLAFYVFAGGLSPPDRIPGIVAGLFAVVVIGFQIVTPIATRSAIVGDQVHKPVIARGRSVMTFFGVPVMVVAVLLAVMELALGIGIGAAGVLLLLLIGFLGILPRYRLRKIEKVLAARPYPPPYRG